MVNGKARFKDRQPGFRNLAVSHCILMLPVLVGSVILLTLNIPQYDRAQIYTGRTSGSNWWKGSPFHVTRRHNVASIITKLHTRAQGFQLWLKHWNHFRCLKSQSCQEISPDWLESESPGLEYRDLHNTPEVTLLHSQTWGPIHIIFCYLIFL